MITPERLYQPQQRVYYYREVASEPIIPFEEHILFQDEQLLVAFKPNFFTGNAWGSILMSAYKTG